MGSSSSSSRSTPGPSTSTAGAPFWRRRRDLDLTPLLQLSTAAVAEELAARHLLNAAFDGDVARVKKWARRLTKSGRVLEGRGFEDAAVGISDPDNHGHGMLHLAAAMGEERMCDFLIRHDKLNVDATDATGMQSISVTRILLESGADPKKADRIGLTGLHIATELDSYEIAELLLSKGAYVDPISQYGETLLHVAARNGDKRILQLLLEHNADFEQIARAFYTPLSVALFGCSQDCLKLLVEAGADVNAGRPVTPLTVAAAEGLPDCVKCLLDAGADANVPDDEGRTPIEIAAFEGSIECVEILFPVTISLSRYTIWSIPAIIQHGKTERIERGSMIRAEGNAAFWKKDYAFASILHTHESSLECDEYKERHEKLMSHFHSMLSCLFSLIFPAMTALFVADIGVSDSVKIMMLTMFLMTGAAAIFGMVISTSLAERKWVPVSSMITLYITLFSLGLFHFSVGLFYPKVKSLHGTMPLCSHSFSLVNIGYFIGSSIVIIFLWGFVFQTPEFLILFKRQAKENVLRRRATLV